MVKKLYRSKNDRVISGICGGLAEYFYVDPIIVRIATVLIGFLTGGAAILFYIIATFIVPKGQQSINNLDTYTDDKEVLKDVEDIKRDIGDWSIPKKAESQKNSILIGTGLIILGTLFLLKQILPVIALKILFPVALIVVGIIIISKHRRSMI